jgi:predicted regulator of Ras-like GTPase activity (Roadblock/LC7/MglB family)
VEAAVVLGRDGLLIDSQSIPGSTRRSRRTHPAIIGPPTSLATPVARRADDRRLEYRDGLAIIAVLNADAILVVLVRPDANVGACSSSCAGNREHIAALI